MPHNDHMKSIHQNEKSSKADFRLKLWISMYHGLSQQQLGCLFNICLSLKLNWPILVYIRIYVKQNSHKMVKQKHWQQNVAWKDKALKPCRWNWTTRTNPNHNPNPISNPNPNPTTNPIPNPNPIPLQWIVKTRCSLLGATPACQCTQIGDVNFKDKYLIRGPVFQQLD